MLPLAKPPTFSPVRCRSPITFQPENCFVRFFYHNTNFRDPLGLRSCSTCGSIVGCDCGSTAQQLLTENLSVCLVRQRPKHAYDPNSKGFRTIPQLFLLRWHQALKLHNYPITKLHNLFSVQAPAIAPLSLPLFQMGKAGLPGGLRIPCGIS